MVSMRRWRTWLAAGTTLAVLATSGLTFAQGAGSGNPRTPGNGVRPTQVAPLPSGPGGTGPGGASGAAPGRRGGVRPEGGPVQVVHLRPRSGRLAPRPNRGRPPVPLLPALRPSVPPVTCFALTTVSGTVAAVHADSLSVAEADGRTLTLPLAVNVVVTEGGVRVPATALAPGEAVTVTVTCRGVASAVGIAG